MKKLLFISILASLVFASGFSAFATTDDPNSITGSNTANTVLTDLQTQTKKCTDQGKAYCELNHSCITIGTSCTTSTPPLLGGDRDEHGCIGSAGYTWCAVLGKCIRLFEQKCEKKQVVPDYACSQKVIDNRDNALIAAWDKYGAAMKTALTARRDALKVAATKKTVKERNLAANIAWRNYNLAANTARRDLNKSKTVAWQTFYKAKKSCKLGSEDKSVEKQDSFL